MKFVRGYKMELDVNNPHTMRNELLTGIEQRDRRESRAALLTDARLQKCCLGVSLLQSVR